MTEQEKPARRHGKAETEEGGTPQSPATDARHPDTEADRNVQPPVQSDSSEELDPADYGFRPIEVTDAEESGPGPVPPVEFESVAGSGSTFSERAKARGGDKAIQSDRSENK